jgi:N-acetylneuraminate lyase
LEDFFVRTFEGFWPALITPYTPDDEINVPMLQTLVAHLLAKGVSGFYICGSTGEGPLQSVAERMLVAETVLAQAAGRVPVIVHVGAAVINDAVALAEHAQAAGADGISSILPPVVYDARGVVPFFARVAAAAPDLPFMPYLYGYAKDAVALMHELEHIPNLAGTKYTAPNMYEMSQIAAFRQEGWTVFSGMDEQAVLGLQYGAAGMIGSTLNFMPGAYREILSAFRAGNVMHAVAMQQRANAVTALLISMGFAGAFREVMCMLGFDCGAPRLPNLPLAGEKRAALRVALNNVGFPAIAAL